MTLGGLGQFPKKKIEFIFQSGIYVCSQCGHELFGSEQKYKHQTPWPAFTKTINENSISKRLEKKDAFKVRIELFSFIVSVILTTIHIYTIFEYSTNISPVHTVNLLNTYVNFYKVYLRNFAVYLK